MFNEVGMYKLLKKDSKYCRICDNYTKKLVKGVCLSCLIKNSKYSRFRQRHQKGKEK